MNYTGLGPSQPIPADTARIVLRAGRRALVLISAVIFALLISGGIFTFTPLIGLHIAHTNGISMEPAHKEGDVVLIKDVDEGDLHVGDVVVFEALGQKIMHRIIEQRAGPAGEMVIVTQGDNVALPDFPIAASQVSGKLVGEVPLLGTLSRLV
ncbi:MAG TPA: signal peptidase I, partial [Dehalococcoidia bacterium]|nr:signal peptidase I [Dehalococcoidia bacterium]